MATLFLEGSVGTGKATKGHPHNKPADIITVRDRLVALGYDWIRSITSGTDKDFIRTIKLFQSICAGHHKFDAGDGRVDLGGNTHRWLAAENAPGWVRIFGGVGVGWRCTSDFDVTNGGFTTTWMRDALDAAGWDYTLRLARVGILRAFDAPPLWVRECSPEHGGDAKGHGSHETGLDVDIRLPLLPPDEHKFDMLAKGFRDPRFDRDASELQLEAIKATMKPRFCFFNDPDFIRKRLCSKENATHDNHYHVRIEPPARQEGIYSLASGAAKIIDEVRDSLPAWLGAGH